MKGFFVFQNREENEHVTRSNYFTNSRTESNSTKCTTSDEPNNDWASRKRNISNVEKYCPGLKRIFGTEQEVAIIAGSGTAGLETAVVNVVKPGDEVLVVVTGAFGDRFTKICEAYNIKTHVLNVEWGKALDPEEVKAYVAEHPEVKVVFSTYCETSTGVLNPIDRLAKAIREVSEALVVVDGVSCVGGVETKMDEWGIDVMVTGSQKAFMLPAGLTFVAASERAWKVIEENEQPRFYLNLKKYRDNLLKDTTPFHSCIIITIWFRTSVELNRSRRIRKCICTS